MNLHLTPLGVTVTGLAWMAIAAAIATVPHRAKRALCAADPGEDHEPDETAILRAQFDALVTGYWFDGALHYTGSHGGAA